MYTTNVATFRPAVKNFFDAIAPQLPADVTISYPVTGDIIDPLDGSLTGTWSAGALTDTTGSDSGVYSAPSGAAVNWNTGTVLSGHRLVGRTFLVPLGGASFDLDGSLGLVPLAALQAAADGLVVYSASTMVIWNRPTLVHAGGFSVVVSATIHDKVAVLRSRRD